MDQPSTPPPLKKRRFFNDPTPHAKQISHSPTPETNDDVATPEQVSEPEDLPSDTMVPETGGEVSNGQQDGFDAALLTSIIGEELPVAAMKRLREVSGDNMERGT